MSVPTEEEVQGALERVLERPEFEGIARPVGAETQLIAELVDAFERALQAVLGDLGANHPEAFAGVLAVLVVLLAWLAWKGARGISRRSAREARSGPQLPEELRGDPASLLRDAERAAGKGNYLEASRLAFRAAIISQAIREGSLERVSEAEGFRRSRTYRELVREFARTDVAYQRMLHLAGRLEAGLYAGESLDEDDWAEARALGGR